MSESNRTQLRYVPEVTYGVTPVDDGGWKPLPFNSESMNVGPATTQSQRIRGTDRMPADLKKVNTNVGGQVGMELSGVDFDDFIQGAMAAAWAQKATITGTTLAVDEPTGTFTDSGSGFITAGFTKGDFITTTAFTNGGNNATWTIKTVVAGTITVETKTGMVTEAAGATATIATSATGHVVAGSVSSVNQFTIEKQFADLTNKYIQLKGCRVGQIDLSFVINEIVTGNITFGGATGLEAAASLVGSGSEAAASGNDVLAGNVDTDFVLYDGVDIATSGIVITRIDLSINNSLRPNHSLTSQNPIDQKTGTHRFSGTIEAYIDNNSWEIYQDMLNNTEVALVFKVSDTGGKGYIVNLPKIKVSGDAPGAAGLDQDNMVRAEFLAIETAPQITRLPGP